MLYESTKGSFESEALVKPISIPLEPIQNAPPVVCYPLTFAKGPLWEVLLSELLPVRAASRPPSRTSSHIRARNEAVKPQQNDTAKTSAHGIERPGNPFHDFITG